eukprot:COSAG04_NODE_2953_length_3350_cov_2.014756_6_plen_122_part_01
MQLKNGSWLLALTNAPFTEGDPRQRVVSMLHPSPDLNKPGWQPPVEIEGPGHGDNASAGWVVPLLAPELGGGVGGGGGGGGPPPGPGGGGGGGEGRGGGGGGGAPPPPSRPPGPRAPRAPPA